MWLRRASKTEVNIHQKYVYQLLAGFLRDIHSRNSSYCSFLDPDDHRFDSLHNGIDNVFQELGESGVGSDSKSAEEVTKEEEAQLWEKGLVGTDSPGVMYYVVSTGLKLKISSSTALASKGYLWLYRTVGYVHRMYNQHLSVQ